MIKRLIITILAITGLTIGSLGAVYFNSPAADALSMKNFDAGNIISDAVFYDGNALSASQIQTFLNNKVPNCDTNGSKPYLWTGKTVKEYWTPRGEPAPYTCLKDWKQKTPSVHGESGVCEYMKGYSSRTAAQIISDVGKACGISPKVLLVLLQKEQSLVTDTSPLRDLQYGSATGMGCPDTAGCDPAYDGFFNQVYGAARQYKLYRASPDNYNHVAGQNNYVRYSPNAACGGSVVYIQNQATAGLYNYTPYQPNKATLDAPYGATAPCGAYGNKNFWYLFNNWFGSSTIITKGSIGQRYEDIGGRKAIGLPTTNEIRLTTGGVYQQFERGRIYWKSGTGAWEVGGSIGHRYYSELSGSRSALGHPTDAEQEVNNGLKYQSFEGGRIYWSNDMGTYSVYGSIGARYLDIKAHESRLGSPTGNETRLSTGGVYQQFERGRIYWKSGTGAWDLGGSIGSRYYTDLNGGASALHYPVGGEVTLPSGVKYQQFEGGRIYWTGGNRSYSIYGSIGGRYSEIEAHDSRLGLPTTNEIRLSTGGVYQQFERGRIYWKSGTGAWEVGGSIGSKYYSLGAEKGRLGYPKSAESGSITSTITQQYEYGKISYKNGVTTYAVDP